MTVSGVSACVKCSPVSTADLVTCHIADPRTTWAVGTFGAIAEFHRDAEESVALSAHGAVTPRGGISLRLGDTVRAIAWECPSSGDSWTHGVALCLPRDEGAMNVRTVVTELGPDAGALREDQRHAVLFDLGIGAAHCDVCVRTADREVLSVLRAAAGRPLLETGLFDALRELSPTRVFLSRLGRLEVCTPIPRPEGRTPDGPHTHVLRDLLRHRRTHSANVPLPESLVPCAEMFPANAIHDVHGMRQRFDPEKHENFQRLLAEYGDFSCMKAKCDTVSAIRAGRSPLEEPSYTRAQRLARRVALRQLAQIDGPSRTLAAWQKAFDRA